VVDAPGHPAGQVDVRVQTAAGTSTTSAKDHYAYQLYLHLAAGVYHSCQISGGSGQVRCWGRNDLGQLGNGFTGGMSTTAVRVSGLAHAVSVVAGGFHNCALLANGKVECWGNNGNGQVGTGSLTTSSFNTPQKVIGLGQPAVAIAAGWYTSCALLVDSTVRCWGFGGNGGLGNGTLTVNSPLPVKVKNLKHAVDIDMGLRHACATRSDGTEWCWGYNASHDLGDGTTTQSDVPVKVLGVTNAVSTSAELETTCVLTKSRTAKCWGANGAGQTGIGSTSPVSHAMTVQGLHGVTRVVAGGAHTCAIVAKHVFCWGSNTSGQLGNGTTTSNLVPSAVPGLSNVTGLTLGDDHTLAVTKGQHTFAWGYNQFGTLGNGTTTNSSTPVPVT
jgi:alpha-tubulin suppressor-like RCC1 family protein